MALSDFRDGRIGPTWAHLGWEGGAENGTNGDPGFSVPNTAVIPYFWEPPALPSLPNPEPEPFLGCWTAWEELRGPGWTGGRLGGTFPRFKATQKLFFLLGFPPSLLALEDSGNTELV